MTQLVKKDSSWRTLRRKAVVGASSFALVAGMGVALAPVASAAVGAPTVTITAPDAIANNGTSPADIKVTVKPASANAADNLPNTTKYRLSLTVPANIKCTDVVLTATPSGTTPPVFTAAAAAGTAPNCTFDSTSAVAVTAASVDWTFKVTIAGHTDATAFDPAVDITGEVGIKFEIAQYEAGAPIVSATAKTELVAAGAATVAESVAVPKYGSVYSETVVKTAGFPNKASSYTVTRAFIDDDGDWDYSDSRPGTTAANVATVSATAHYMSLNKDITSFAALADGSYDGFYFNTDSGKVVYGTITKVSTAYSFTAKAVNKRGTSPGTWTVTAVQTSANWPDAKAVSAKDGNPGNLAGSVNSAQFSLTVGFSDVASDNVFKDAIEVLNGQGIVKGNADGTFGYANKVTRGEFAAFAYRLLNKPAVANAQVTPKNFQCSATNASVFTDVANINVFCNEINTLAALGVVKGTSADKFSPNAPITRDQIAAFIYRMNAVALNNDVVDASVADTQFTDVTKANIFSGDIAWGAGTGIINGRTATKFDPAANVLRQEAAGLLYRFGHNQFGAF